MNYGGKMIRNDFKRIFSSFRFYLALGIGLFILLRPLVISFTHLVRGTFLEVLTTAFALSDFTPFAAIFCVLPFADSFCQDYQSGYVSFIAGRTGIKKYARYRCMTVMLSGAILMALTVGITILVCAVLADAPETAETAQFLGGSIWYRSGILLENQALFVLLKILLGFLFGGLWALVGLVVSVLIPNGYVTLIAPFVLYQVLWLLLEGSAVNPVYMLRGDSNYLPSPGFVLLWQIFLIVLCYIVACKGIQKRVEV